MDGLDVVIIVGLSVIVAQYLPSGFGVWLKGVTDSALDQFKQLLLKLKEKVQE